MPARRRDQQRRRESPRLQGGARRGSASLDYVLILGVVLPMVALSMTWGKRLIQLAYDMVSGLISWPFM
jgi:hypothetical protein